MKFRLYISVLAALVLALGLAISVEARQPGRAGNGYCGGQNLTQEQQAQYKGIMDAHFGDMTELRKQVWAKNDEIDQELSSDTPDKGRIQALTDELKALNGQIIEKRVALRGELTAAGLPLCGPGFGGRGRHGSMGGCGPMGGGMGMGAMMGGCSGGDCSGVSPVSAQQ